MKRWRSIIESGTPPQAAFETVEREYLWAQYRAQTERMVAEDQAFEAGVVQSTDELIEFQEEERKALEERERLEKMPRLTQNRAPQF